MYDVFFNIALNGVHVFRTDTYHDPENVRRIRAAFISHFPRSQGYAITEYTRDRAWQTREIAEG